MKSADKLRLFIVSLFQVLGNSKMYSKKAYTFIKQPKNSFINWFIHKN